MNRSEVLDDEFDLAVLIVRDAGTVAYDIGAGDGPAAYRVHRLSDVDGIDSTVLTGSGVPEQAVALGADDLIHWLSERLDARSVDPDDVMLIVVDDDYVVHHIQNHVHELLRVEILVGNHSITSSAGVLPVQWTV